MTYSSMRGFGKALTASIAGCLLAFTPVESQAYEQHWNPDPGTFDAIFWLAWAGGFCADAACAGGWVGESYPSLGIGETASFTSASASPGYYLGNSLSGTFNVSLSPVFRIAGSSTEAYGAVPPQDELRVYVVDRSRYLSNTDLGQRSFTAQAGMDYYLLLGGVVRRGQTYSLQVAQVPEPASWLLFSLGIGSFLILRRREARN